MDNEYEIMSQINNFAVTTIPDETKFWMIRTQKGFFFEEFIQDKFVALAWNTIDKDNVNSKEEELQEQLNNDFPEYQRPKMIINKCKTFINTVSIGDIVIIPSAGKREVAIGIMGEYYEKKDCSLDDEKEITALIKAEGSVIKKIDCPYKKRRSITLLRIVKPEQINNHLLMAMTSQHGITNLDNYANDILRLLFNIYSFRNDVCVVYNVGQTGPISPRALSKILYGSTMFFSEIVSEEKISTKVNLNSLGDIVIFLNDCKKVLTSNIIPILALFGALTGFNIKGVKWPGIPDFIKSIVTFKSDVKAHKDENEMKGYDCILKKIEIIEKAKKSGINLNEIDKSLNMINESLEALEIKPIEEEFTSIPKAFEDAQQKKKGKKKLKVKHK